MGSEYELKYRADEEALSSVRTTFPARWQKIPMETTYYDTPSRSLSARHYTLRRRMENDVSVCTLKTPAEGHGRQELETQCRNIEDAIPVLCKLGAPGDFSKLAAEGIAPVCGAKFSRQAISLDLEDCRVELALDTGILTSGGRSQPLCELEVELKEGSKAAAEQFAFALAAIYGLELENRSKFRRALSLAQGE